MTGIAAALNLTTLPQKVMLGGLAAALIAASTFNVVQAVENRRLSREKGDLETEINDPNSGYVVRLTQARSNTATCTAAIGHQNDVIRSQSSKDTATIAAVRAAYDAEHVARIRAEKSAAAFLAHEPKGTTVAERIADVDAQILGDLH